MDEDKDKKDKVVNQEDLQKALTEVVELKLRELGLDKAKRKEGVVGDGADDASLKGLTGEQKIVKFMQAVILGDNVTAKALSEGVGADGGYLVPTEFRASVVEKLEKEAVIRPRATVIPMSRDRMEVPAEGANITAYWKAENSPLTESNPTFAQIVLNTNKLTGLSKMSRELFADSAVSVAGYITGLYARKFAAEEDKAFMAGAGTTEPKGIRTYTNASVPQAGASLVADDLIKLFYTLPSQYRTRAVWLLHNDIIKLVRSLKDLNGRYLWTDGLADAAPTILGRPVLEQNDIPTNLGAGTDESEIFIGDLSYYLIGDREQIGVETTTEGAGAFETHQVAVKSWERLDGQLSQTEAFRLLSAVK